MGVLLHLALVEMSFWFVFCVVLLLPQFLFTQYFFLTVTQSGLCIYAIVVLICLLFIATSSFIESVTLFILCALMFCFFLWSTSAMLSLLFALIYLGGLIVLLSYFWMFLPVSSLSVVTRLGALVFFASPFSFIPTVSGSIYNFLFPTSFLLWFGCLLFLAIVVVVAIVDLQEGSFSS